MIMFTFIENPPLFYLSKSIFIFYSYLLLLLLPLFSSLLLLLLLLSSFYFTILLLFTPCLSLFSFLLLFLIIPVHVFILLSLLPCSFLFAYSLSCIILLLTFTPPSSSRARSSSCFPLHLLCAFLPSSNFLYRFLLLPSIPIFLPLLPFFSCRLIPCVHCDHDFPPSSSIEIVTLHRCPRPHSTHLLDDYCAFCVADSLRPVYEHVAFTSYLRPTRKL